MTDRERIMALAASLLLALTPGARAQVTAATCDTLARGRTLGSGQASTLARHCGETGRTVLVARYRERAPRSGDEEAALAYALSGVRSAAVFEAAIERLANRGLPTPARLGAVLLLTWQWNNTINLQRDPVASVARGTADTCRGGVLTPAAYPFRSPLPSDSAERFTAALEKAMAKDEPDLQVRTLAACAFRHSRGTMPLPTEAPEITVSSPCESTFDFHNPGRTGVEFNWWDSERRIGGLETVPAKGTIRRYHLRITAVEIKVAGVTSGPYLHRAEKCKR